MWRWLFVWAVSASAANAACDTPASVSDLGMALDEAMGSFGRLEIDAFKESVQVVEQRLPCLDEPISRSAAAAYHRVIGLAHFLDRDAPRARKSFASARTVEPDYVFPTDVIPEGNPIRADYAAVDPEVGPFETAVSPKNKSVRLNGMLSIRRPVPLPVIVQVLDGRGGVQSTTLVAGGTSLPVIDEGALSSKPVSPRAPSSGPRKGLLVASAAGLGVAGILYGGALVTQAGFQKSDDVGSLKGRQATNNALVIGSAGVAVASLGVGTAAFLVAGSF